MSKTIPTFELSDIVSLSVLIREILEDHQDKLSAEGINNALDIYTWGDTDITLITTKHFFSALEELLSKEEIEDLVASFSPFDYVDLES